MACKYSEKCIKVVMPSAGYSHHNHGGVLWIYANSLIRSVALPFGPFCGPVRSARQRAEKPKDLHNINLLVLSITSSQRISDLGKIMCQMYRPS